ncbi:MAG: ferritin-like domain-containing protein [Byssovorax sp.]
MTDLPAFRQIFRARLLALVTLAAAGGPIGLAACGGKVIVDDTSGGGGGSGGAGGGTSTATGSPHTTKCFTFTGTECPPAGEAGAQLGLACDQSAVGSVAAGAGQCCYEIASTPENCGSTGRPFFVGERTVVAPADRAGEGWRAAAIVPSLDGLSGAERALLADAWTRDALGEHASIASFGRFALELLAERAPAELVTAAHQAAIDEVNHATLCFSLASAYRGEPVTPGAFPFGGAVHLATDLASLAESAVIEGCIGETIAALTAAEQLERATDPAVRAALSVIAADEARHAELAWATVAWAIRKGGAAVKRAVAAAFSGAERTATSLTSNDPESAALDAHGMLTAAARAAVHARALREVVLPCAEALLADRIESSAQATA